jgi:thiamine-phosphate pyrophosphorylase
MRKKKRPLGRLYLITERALVPGGDLLLALEGALRGGADLIQLREKDLLGGEIYRLAESVKALVDSYQGRLLINDRVDVAAAVGAAGVHLGKAGIPVQNARAILGKRVLIGYSAHSVEEARMAQAMGADFVTLSPIFPGRKYGKNPLPQGTASPPETISSPNVLGLEGLKGACQKIEIPTFALGGVTEENAAGALEVGAYGVALISSILSSRDPAGKTREVLGAVKRWTSPK